MYGMLLYAWLVRLCSWSDEQMPWHMGAHWLDPVQRYYRQQRRKRLAICVIVGFLLLTAGFWTYVAETPRDYTDIREHFKYGSIGSDGEDGLPYAIWQVLPAMFPEYLPEPERYRALPVEDRTALAGYKQFGFLVEAGRDLPIGFSKRRVYVDRVGLNCAICHVGTVKSSPGMSPEKIYADEPGYLTTLEQERVLILGMPANTVDLRLYAKFLQMCAQNDRFTETDVLAAIRKYACLGPIETLILRKAVPRVKAELLKQAEAFAFLDTNPASGPGRIDTFNPYKYKFFGFPQDKSVGTADFPSIWNQRPREGMHLHWDGNNTSVFERNLSASMGAGATPVSVDIPRVMRTAYWLGAPDPKKGSTQDDIVAARVNPVPKPGELPIPKYPFAIDEEKAQRGQGIYQRYCASCHDWSGEFVGQVEPIDKVGTDRSRLESFSSEFAFNQNTFGAGQWWRFKNFRKTNGYVNMPLDGLWARAPYLHNGSVPTLRDLLKRSKDRPRVFTRGDDVYDPKNVGFRSDPDRERSDDGRKLFRFETILPGTETTVPGNGNGGHEGPRYGTELPENDKEALLEYLKKL
jgi:hypothetical protein